MIYVTVGPASVLVRGAGCRDILFDIVNKQGTVVGEKPVVPSSSVQHQQETRSSEKSCEASGQRPSSTLVMSIFFSPCSVLLSVVFSLFLFSFPDPYPTSQGNLKQEVDSL